MYFISYFVLVLTSNRGCLDRIALFVEDDSFAVVHSNWIIDEIYVRWSRSESWLEHRLLLGAGKPARLLPRLSLLRGIFPKYSIAPVY